MEKAKTVTELETKMLVAIRDNEYHDGRDPVDSEARARPSPP